MLKSNLSLMPQEAVECVSDEICGAQVVKCIVPTVFGRSIDTVYEAISREKPDVVLCIGQAVVDCITRGVEEDPFGRGKTRAQSITLSLGGDAVNESFVLASLGHRVGLMCAVGDDLAGRFVMNEASRRGLDVSGVTMVPGLVTPVANMFVKLDGSRSSVTSAASMLPGYEPRADFIRGCVREGARIVSFASLFRAPLDQPSVVCELVRAVHESGAVVCADTKIPTFRKMDLSELEPVLPMIDYIFPNDMEAAFLAGMDGGKDLTEEDLREMAEALLAKGIGHVVIKTGEKGCYAASQGVHFTVPARKVPVVDTTGAGDNLVAGFMDALLADRSFRECCEAGIRTAAESVQHLGATPN